LEGEAKPKVKFFQYKKTKGEAYIAIDKQEGFTTTQTGKKKKNKPRPRKKGVQGFPQAVGGWVF